jgi:hypothetical protein
VVRRGVVILLVGLGLGILADGLFHGAEPGLNVPLWMAALAAAGWWLRRPLHQADPLLLGLLGLLVFFAACVAWRASPFLRFWNLAALCAAGVAIATQLRQPIATAWPRDYLRGAVGAVRHLVTGPGLAGRDLPLPGPASPALRRRFGASAVGTLLAVPVLLIFGGLLTSADPIVEAFVRRLFDWNLPDIFEHGGIVISAAWVAVGWMCAMTASRNATASPEGVGSAKTLGVVELGIPLGTLTVLLVCFVAVQARYLFGGEAIMRLTGLTYAEFARRGFFQLVWLAALVIPLLMAAQYLLDRRSRPAVESFHALAVVLAGLVGLVMASALARMKLYVTAYGLTEDRLYATAFLAWVGGVLLLFVVTELRNRPQRFTTGAVLAGFAVIASLTVLNPDGLIARTNLARAGDGLPFDAAYLARLSVDAVPAVAAGWDGLDAAAQERLAQGVLARATGVEDWREWSWAAWQAARAVRALPELTPARQGP